MKQISTYSKMNAHLLTHTHISRMALYAAFLFIGVMCSVGNVWAQVTLTYEWTVTAGKSSLPSGVTQDGLGSDYAAANAPYYLKYDGAGDYIQIHTDAAASEVKFTVKMLGGNATSKFKVQGCETDDGDYSDIEEFTCSGAQNDVKTFTTSNTISSSYRYFRIIKSVHASGGNVGLGYVKITKAPTPATITLNNYSGSASTSGYLEGEEFELPSTNSYTCGTKTFVGWSTVEVATTDTKPSSNFYEPGESVTLGATNTFYAVFANRSGGGSPAFSRYQLVTSAPSDWSGKYVLSTGTYTATGAYSSNSLTCNSWTPGTTEATSREFIINKIGSTSHYSIALPGGTTYIGKKTGNSPGTDLISSTTAPTTADDDDNNKYKWTLSTTVIANVALTGRKLAAESSTPSKIKGYSDPESGSTYPVIKLYKRIEESTYTYSNYATNCCEAPGTALSITSSSSVATGGTVTLTSTGGNGGTVTWSVVNGTGSATIEGTTLTAGSVGTVTVKAHQDATGDYCEQDAEQAFTIIPATVNVTGVEVSPTSKAIVLGETFDITPTISPSNATDKSVSWTSSASDKASVSSGTVTGVAAGTATITCTTTDGSKTATTAVTVYAVTMQALDEDGNAIAVGGPGTPSRTGASISPAADAGNYVFKEWAISGASLGSSASTKANTITNPTGAVTVTAKYYKPRVVKWSVNGDNTYDEGSPTLTVAYNSAISAVPDAPDDDALNNCANKFMGWSTKSWGSTTGKDDSDYDDLFTTADGYTTGITDATKTFYAVFAESTTPVANTILWKEEFGYATGGAKTAPSEGATVYSGTITYTMNNGTGSSQANTEVKASDSYAGGSAPELMIGQGNTTAGSFVVSGLPKENATELTLTFKKNNNTLTPTVNNSYSITKESGSGAGTWEYTITCNSSSTFNLTFTGSTSNVRVDDIILKVKTPGYSNYVTECAADQVRVTYDFNGGTGTACTQGVTTTNANFTVCSTTPTKDYYDFAGWNDGTSTYNAGATGYNLASSTTFTAQWTPTTYDITYELDEGTNDGDNPATYNVTTETITLKAPTRDHDRFDGWYKTYSAGVYSDPVTSIPLGSHGDITLYAKWAERHEIIFDADGATTTIYRADDEDLSASVAEQGSVPSDPDAPTTCSSKVFVGWSESTIDGETDTEPGDLMKPAAGTVDEDKHYYAVWATSTSGSKTLVMEITRADFDDSYHNGAEQSHTSTAVANDGSGATLSVSWKSVNVGDFSSKIQVKDASGAGFWNTTDLGSISSVSITTGNNITHFENTSVHPTSTSGTSKGYFTVTKSGGTGTATKVTVTFTKTVSYYIAYSTSCCATKVTLSQNSPSNGTIAFGKTRVGTCGGDKDVTLTITPAAGYQLHSYEVATGSGKVATKSVSPAISLDNNSSAAQNITLTFAEDANGAYDVTASFTEMVASAWTWTKHVGGATITTEPVEVYVGQKVQVDVSYEPAGLLSNHTNASAYNYSPSPWSNPNLGSPAKAGDHLTVTGTNAGSTSVVLNHNDGLTKTIYYTVLALPLVHFVDNIHGETFANVVATVSGDSWTVTTTLPTPTHSDVSDPGASYNTCERQHLHLIGWIESTWADAHPGAASGEITGAGSGIYYEAGASINVEVQNGKTFYAVWCIVE